MIIGKTTKIRLFNTNVKSVLLYRAGKWRTNNTTRKMIQASVNQCLRKILGIQWMDKVSNKDLWEKTHQVGIEINTLKKNGDGLATHWESQTSTLRDRPWRGTLRASERGETEKHMATWPWGRHHPNGAELETTGENRPGQETLETSCAWPMLQAEPMA